MSDTATFSERLVNRIARIGGRGSSRRGFLGGAALVGAALAVDPWGYLTRPTTAYAATCGTDASCGAGYSVFCCTINGGRNTCPSGTFAGGWWKADRSSYCGGAARYYIDCNVLPGHHFRCRCNTTSCDHRLVACNWFRYGQCSTHIKGVTPVVCRQISCTPPWQIYKSCGRSSATDNNTARHTAPCLTEPEDGSLFPNNWLRPRVKVSAPGAKVLEIRFQADKEANDLVVYTAQDSWAMDKTMWRGLATHVIDQPITVSVRAVGASGLTAAATGSFTIAPVQAGGQMVYWALRGFDASNPDNEELFGFSVGDETVGSVLKVAQVQQTSSGVSVGCIGCHTGFAFTDHNFYDIGLPGTDKGRGKEIDLRAADHAFKTPTLRELAWTAPYMHDGSIATLDDVIDHYQKGRD